MGIWRIRLQTRAGFEVRLSFVITSDPLEQSSVIEMELAVVRLNADRRLHMRDRSIEFGFSVQHNSKVHMRFRVSRVETECDFVLLFGLLQLAFLLQRQSVIKMLAGAGWHIGYHPCAPLNLRNRTMHLPEPEGA